MPRIRAKLQGQVLKEIELFEGSEYLIGRSSLCDLYLKESKEISRNHVKIMQDENGQWVAQLMARFGELLVNNESVSHVVLDENPNFHMSPYSIEFLADSPVVQEETPDNPSTFPQAFKDAELSHAAYEDPQVAQESEPQQPSQSLVPVPSEAASHQEFHETSPHQEAHPSSSASSPEQPEPYSFDQESPADDETTLDGISNQLGAYLEVLWEDRPKESIPLQGKRWVIGRDINCEVVISEKYISRQQFKIKKKNNKFYIFDLGSSNGTSLNGTLLQPKSATPLGSNDIITAKTLKIKFLIKNHSLQPSFHEQREDEPEAQPLVPYIPPALVDEASPDVIRIPSHQSKWKSKAMVLRGSIAILVLMIGYGLLSPTDKNKEDSIDAASSSKAEDGFSQLPADKQMVIVDTFNLSRTHYTQGNYELCLSEAKKLHQIIAFYENSKEIESLCEQGQALLMKEREKERRLQAARELREHVNGLIQKCRAKINHQTTVIEINRCLSEVRESDPGNSQIQDLITEVKIRQQQRVESSQKKARYQRRVQQGVNAYQTAKKTYKKGSLSAALQAYEKYLNSPYPDPKKLKVQAKRELSSIRSKLNKKVRRQLNHCEKLLGEKGYKKAIRACEKVLAEDSSNQKAENLRHEALSQLRKKMKGLYQDAILREQFGDIQAAKENWFQIIKENIPTDEYYQKAKRKLKKYGDET